MRDLHAERGRQAVAHRAEPAGRHPAVGLLEVIMLRRPHLMLADLGGDVGIHILGRRVEPLHRVLRHDHVVVRLVGERVARPPAGDLLPPRIERLLVGLGGRPPQPHDVLENPADIAQNADIGTHVLVDRRGIDIDMDLLRVRRERTDPAGDAVVETRADADHDVAIVHRHVGFVGAVHAEHADPVLAARRIGAETHQRRGDRKARQIDQLAQADGSPRARN